MSAPSLKYLCPHCQKASRLPEPTPKEGKFQLTCAHCSEKVVLQFIDYRFEIVQVLPSVKEESNQSYQSFKIPVPNISESIHDSMPKKLSQTKVKPFFEKKVVWEKELKKEFSNSKRNPFGLSKRNQSPKKSSTKYSYLRVAFTITSILLFLFIVSFSYFVAGVLTTKKEVPIYLEALAKNIPTKILDRNGQVVSEIFQKRTSTLRLQDYPEDMISILLNIEDQKFFFHGGIDYSAIFRAFFKNIVNLSYKQGASTITQQLARIILDDRRKSLNRKWREAQLAFALESILTKEQILETYMNHVYLGHGAFGFGEGIKFYFQKNPMELSKEEMVLLASLPSAPNKYSPLKNPEDSYTRVRAILNMFRNRGIYPNLDRDKFISLYHNLSTRSPNETVFGSRHDIAPYVTEHVRAVLSSLEGEKNIYESGGYTVETTLDRNAQEVIGPIVREYLSKNKRSGKIQKKRVRLKQESPLDLAFRQRMEEVSLLNELVWNPDQLEGDKDQSIVQAAIVGIQPNTGQVLFLHGGDEFNSQNQFNRATQMRRQTGSSIKAVLYASAIDNGSIHAGMKILDAPLYYRGGGGKEWAPENLGGSFDGEISLRTALVKSKNTAAVQVAERLGSVGIEKYFTKFFFPNDAEKKNRYRGDLSLALGTLEISPLEMASAFTSFVNQGTIKRPYLIQRIKNAKGTVLYEVGASDEFKLKLPEERQVIRPDTAEVMVSLLRDSGRASGVRNGGYTGDLIGKTGTTNDYKDAWFVGARPDLSLAVWVGYDNPKFGMGPSGLGGAVAAPLWGEILATIDKKSILPKTQFSLPVYAKPYKICNLTGKQASPTCPSTQELYLSDYPPEGPCNEDHKSTTSDHKDLMKGLY
ncbi:transglycosylase [Leptospira yanagawae serovar Saopaulo str. Sao Paulo = ATCC 700523]|uniref:peptidoglycan glycosyltransferase n=1 Tax=Leptospira yanagawae serovar Saopaulo str. Sao Paulo = ATCC 700523 TaxID=1249483 RepID=A0A5E8HEU3_9LEPT|nr:transglycosylase domain-containing protein [Leptospira yanagawae]EOQ89769.1 transglycosylase [Leptospira yanagawae serovar Saopaulo str. Sao Paulo = ATCC 700523]